MPIEKCFTKDVMPSWLLEGGTRYLANPTHRLCFLQLAGETEILYVVSDQPLPKTVDAAIAMVEAWRIADEIDRDERSGKGSRRNLKAQI